VIKRILIVDDSGVSRKITRKCLEFAGLRDAEYLEAADGEQALERFEQGGVDLLVTDLNMPVMDGFELLRALQALPKAEPCLVLVTSSAASAALEPELASLGVAGVFAKPLVPMTIAKLLAGHLSGARS
jgi:two-component system chemotaxis response regulator CheY